MNALLILKQSVSGRLAKVAGRRTHDLALRDPRVAAEHFHASQQAVDRGESGCVYCS
jgi:hypothetical protein